LALIDPHGDLAEGILDYIPEHRIDDVIFFNPTDTGHPIPFNPLECANKNYHHIVASGLISVLKKIWSDFWGPRLEHILRHSILTLLENPNNTILDIPRLLTNKDFRELAVRGLANQHVKEFWFSEFEKYSAWLRTEAVSPILNKMSQFLTNPPLRNIVGQKKNTFNMRNIMDEGKILIVNLAKGKIGEDNCSLLGSMIVTRIWLAALSRANIPENERRPFYLYVDEIHNFLTLSFADILSEARKYGLNLTLAHQYIEQLDEKIRKAILGNVGTVISFRIGIEDAELLAKEFYPIFTANDLINLPNYHIYLKLMIDGATSQPFSAITLPPPEKGISYKESIIKLCRERYSRPRKDAENELLIKSYSSAIGTYDQKFSNKKIIEPKKTNTLF